jgi:chromosome segregation ATPase
LTVGIQDPPQQLDDPLEELWRQVGEQLIHRRSRVDARFDRLEGDVSVLKADVSVLRTDVAVLKADVSVLKTDVAVLKADVSVLKTDVAVLKADVSVLKTDVAVLKIDVAETKEQLGRLERATESRFNRVDAQLERLITLVQRAETKRS